MEQRRVQAQGLAQDPEANGVGQGVQTVFQWHRRPGPCLPPLGAELSSLLGRVESSE